MISGSLCTASLGRPWQPQGSDLVDIARTGAADGFGVAAFENVNPLRRIQHGAAMAEEAVSRTNVTDRVPPAETEESDRTGHRLMARMAAGRGRGVRAV